MFWGSQPNRTSTTPKGNTQTKKMGPENISSVPFDVEKFAEFKDDFFNKTKIADLSPANSVQAGKKH